MQPVAHDWIQHLCPRIVQGIVVGLFDDLLRVPSPLRPPHPGCSNSRCNLLAVPRPVQLPAFKLAAKLLFHSKSQPETTPPSTTPLPWLQLPPQPPPPDPATSAEACPHRRGAKPRG
eukprot:CAMPEP_0174902258 /NCGR_PEP_ID=MMETSP0167-20121228/37366_1 /TAXON_ID=38298 /ORGANISM="Rhodella maculata, Strain CCMP736" /LENGTH=116 /DNA_ID=CAMNT_0016144209 /DNA_START=47 /DNA_END=393 /DNA_ORIENTATION=-